MNGVFLDEASLGPNDLDLQPLRQLFSDYQAFATTAPDDVASRIQGKQVVICNKVVLDEKLLAQAPDLKLICVAATGTNNIDLEAAKKHNIAVCNVTHYAAESVSQHVLSLILRLMNASDSYQQAVSSGKWSDSPFFCLLDYPIREVRGLTLGIIGYGVLGKATAELARCMGMKVLIAQSLRAASLQNKPVADADEERVSLPRLYQQADIISLHCPLTESTHNLIDTNAFAQMKNSAIVINTARGGIVNEAALLQALQTGQIGGAGLDVLTDEPPPANHPLLNCHLNNLVITPHIAWASREARQRLSNIMCENIRSFQTGVDHNRVV